MWYNKENNDLTINIYIQPGAKCTEIVGYYGDALKIRLASPPIDGRANEALLKYIAQIFDVPIRQVQLKKGDKSRNKRIVITGSQVEPLSLIK